MNNNTKKEEAFKQGKNYLSEIYSIERRPITKYPLQLVQYLKNKYLNEKENKNLSVLDIGCGRGDILKAFKEIGCNVAGIDLSEEAISLCMPIEVRQINVENEININNYEKKFDIIFSKSLIEHLKEPIKFFEYSKKMLKEDGMLIVLTPSWVHHSFGPFYLDFTHITPFTLHSLRDIGKLSGFNFAQVEYFYQLPIIWRYNFLKIFSKLVSFLKIPYLPMYEGLTRIKWPEEINKYLRHSNEVMLLGIFKIQ
jgi:2-polyprenyl-3-methyl-5-hydroxy-6-metoxy-1,4-benzoquinol methylase